jgi:hypothetical protein
MFMIYFQTKFQIPMSKGLLDIAIKPAAQEMFEQLLCYYFTFYKRKP